MSLDDWTEEEELIEPDLDPAADKFKVTLEITVKAHCSDDAEDVVKEIMAGGVLAYMDENDVDPVESWDVNDVEPAELP